MSNDLEKISSFLSQHHVLSLGTHDENELSVCSLFYTYFPPSHSFIVASSDDTTHIKHIINNSQVAGNILLETKNVGQIQGVQFRGNFTRLDDDSMKERYFKAFISARDMNPIFWKIQVKYFKMTDNTQGFGKKIIWRDASL